MKVPSMEEAILIFIKALQAFEEEVEEFLEALSDKLRNLFGY